MLALATERLGGDETWRNSGGNSSLSTGLNEEHSKWAQIWGQLSQKVQISNIIRCSRKWLQKVDEILVGCKFGLEWSKWWKILQVLSILVEIRFQVLWDCILHKMRGPGRWWGPMTCWSKNHSGLDVESLVRKRTWRKVECIVLRTGGSQGKQSKG